MNVYDFDQTIFYPDSVMSFVLWAFPKYPGKILPYALTTIGKLLKWKTGIIKRYRFERQLNQIFTIIPDVEQAIEEYWDTHMSGLSPWYLKQKQPDDLIISASPECFLKPLANRLNVHLIATKFDIETGVVIGNINLAKEKARYIIEAHMPVIDAFYSDSLSDTPVALLAEKAYLVTNKAKTVIPWPQINEKNIDKIKSKIDIGDNYKYKL